MERATEIHPHTKTLLQALDERILVLDGGFGTMVQTYGLTEADFRGERFADWPTPLTRPSVVREIHEKYLQAGADLVTTDSFNANAVSLADYGLSDCAREIARAAARIAREAADEYTLRNPQKPRFAAGSIGPTNRTASMSADVADPAAREVTFRQLADAYTEQVEGLIEGGVDMLLIETVFDTLNAKAALYAIDRIAGRTGRRLPVMISGTLADAGGRTLSGQTVEAFCASVAHASRPIRRPVCPTSWAATTKRPRCSPKRSASTCGADWSISSADAAARRPPISSNCRRSSADSPRGRCPHRATKRF